MQGKVALEEHFAIPETVQDSAGFVPGDYWVELKARLLDMQDRRLREMDANGIEVMLPSLNAPAVQAIPDRKQAIEIARRANDFLAGEVAKRPDRFQGLAALPMQDPDAATRELDALRARPRHSRRAGQRLQPGRRPGRRHLLRPAAVPAVLGRGRTAGRAVLPASAQPAARARPYLRAAIPGCSARPGRSRKKPPCTRCVSWPRACSMRTRNCESSSAISAKACPIRCGASTIATAGSRRRRRSGEASARRIFSRELLHHHLGEFPHPDADRRHAGDRRGSHPVLGRLAVREHRPRRQMVRRLPISEVDRLKIGRTDAMRLFKLDGA